MPFGILCVVCVQYRVCSWHPVGGVMYGSSIAHACVSWHSVSGVMVSVVDCRLRVFHGNPFGLSCVLIYVCMHPTVS